MARETLDVYKQALEERKVLVIKLGGLGDLILVTPSLRALRRYFPKARISLLIDERFSSIVENCPYVNELILFDRRKESLAGLVSELRRRNFDISLDFKNSNFTHIAAYLSKIPYRYGFSKGLVGFLLNHPERLSRELAEEPVRQQFRILRRLGIVDFDDALELWTSAQDDNLMQEVLKGKGVSSQDKVIGLSLSASPEWPTKNWPLEKFSELSRLLIQKGFKVVLLGSAYLKEKMDIFPKDENIIDLVGDTDLRQLVSLISRLDAMVTADSAPMHIAASLNTKIVALFGPTNPKRHTPPARYIEVLTGQLGCQPCYKRACFNKDKMACLNKISAQEVLDKIIGLI